MPPVYAGKGKGVFQASVSRDWLKEADWLAPASAPNDIHQSRVPLRSQSSLPMPGFFSRSSKKLIAVPYDPRDAISPVRRQPTFASVASSTLSSTLSRSSTGRSAKSATDSATRPLPKPARQTRQPRSASRASSDSGNPAQARSAASPSPGRHGPGGPVNKPTPRGWDFVNEPDLPPPRSCCANGHKVCATHAAGKLR